jgi:MFS family permease
MLSPSVAVGSGRRAVVLAICCSALFMVGLDNTIVNVGLPEIGRSLNTSISGLQWTVAGYTIALASLLLFSGALADRIGRRTVFQVGLSLFTLGSWLCSLAPSLPVLIAFRVLQGVGGSMLNPAALGIITNTFVTPADRAKAIGVWDGVSGLSMALGPVIGGILVGSVGWRGIFWANIPVGLVAISLTALLVPDSKAALGRKADPVGQVLVIAMLGSLAYAIIQGPSAGWFSPEIIGFFGVSVCALVFLLRYEPRRAQPLIDFRFFKSVPFSAANATAICAIAASAGFLFLTTLYLQDVRGFTALRAGLTLLPMPVMMAVAPRRRPRPVRHRRRGAHPVHRGTVPAVRHQRPALPHLHLRAVRHRRRDGERADLQRRHVRRPQVPGGCRLRHELLEPSARPVSRRGDRRLGPGRFPARHHERRLPARRARRLVDHGRLRLRGPGSRRDLHDPVGQGHRRQGRRGPVNDRDNSKRRRRSAAAAGTAAAATAATASGGRRARAAGRETANSHRAEQLDGVGVALRARRRSAGLAHRAGQQERIAAGAAAELVSGHAVSLRRQSRASPAPSR